jgi:Ser/Thr protein kinase RdoA (MazF antagonist)
LWSLFRFIPGEYYNGRDAQLEVAADMAARLHSALFETPQQWLPDAGPIHFSERDNDVFLQARARIDDWEDIFGPECALVLAENWKTVEAAWVKLRRATPDSGAMQPAHFDLHPHNILMLNHNIVAVLDFDACKLMPPGYALAFAGLKLCRQAVAEFGGELTAAAAGRKFVQTVCEREPRYVSQVKHFSVLAIAEVLRRIGIILRLNLVDSDKTWNHVLPIQIKHIGEAQALFGEL